MSSLSELQYLPATSSYFLLTCDEVAEFKEGRKKGGGGGREGWGVCVEIVSNSNMSSGHELIKLGPVQIGDPKGGS